MKTTIQCRECSGAGRDASHTDRWCDFCAGEGRIEVEAIPHMKWTYDYNCGYWSIMCGNTHIGIAMTEKSAKAITSAHNSAIVKELEHRE